MIQVLSTACPLDCPDTCSLSVTVDDGRIVKIDADTGPEANPYTQGFICHKVKHHAKRVYSPERIMTPLIRSGPKGSGEFRNATWDEANSLIASQIQAAIASDGANSVLAYLYSSSAGALESAGLAPVLFRELGCPEIEHTICASTVGAAWDQMFGSMLSADPNDIDHSELIVVWGANPTASNTHFLPLLTAASKRGAKIVVIDPRMTGVAKRADMHIALLPGTDVVLAMALVRWLRDNGHVACDFVAANTVGYEEFVAAAGEWTLERAAAACGVEAAQIEALGELIAGSSPAMLRLGLGLERNRNGGSSCLAAQGLWLVAGHFGELGSGIIGSTSGAVPLDMTALRPVREDKIVQAKMNMNDVADVLLGKIAQWPKTRVLIIQGANPVATAMDQQSFIAGLEREDLFTVVHEQVMTDSAVLADVVLPATTHFEIADLVTSYGVYSMLEVKPVIDRVGESRSNNEFASGLAVALGLPLTDFNQSPAALARTVRTDNCSGSVLAVRAPRHTVQFADTWPVFREDSAKARLCDTSSAVPVPHFIGPNDRSDDDRFVLLTPASHRTINSMFAEFEESEPAVSIHPADAVRHGIENGDSVAIFNNLGEVGLLAYIDGSVRQGVLSTPKGMWRRHFADRFTANLLIAKEINDMGGGACFNDARVSLRKVSRVRDEVPL